MFVFGNGTNNCYLEVENVNIKNRSTVKAMTQFLTITKLQETCI